jgi:predicted nucleic acid-binding protein
MNVFLDTNILIDVIANRPPFYQDSAAIWTMSESRKIRGLVSAVTFTNIFYIVRKLRDRKTAQRTMILLHDTFTPVACDAQVLRQAIDADFDDFEDAVQYHSALRGKAACLVTRNPDHFPTTGLPVLGPGEFLAAHGTA